MIDIKISARHLAKENKWLVLVDHADTAFVVENRILKKAFEEAGARLEEGGYL